MTTRSWNLGAALTLVLLALGTAPNAVAQGAAETPPTPSLYTRLGGLAPISVVVSDFIDVLVPDPVLNANPAIDAARKHVAPAYLKYQVTALVCQVTGGACQYQGRAMKESHARLNISEAEWSRMVTLFKEVLAKHKVPAKEAEELVAIVASTKGDIVAARTVK
jgi:hemoglobin